MNESAVSTYTALESDGSYTDGEGFTRYPFGHRIDVAAIARQAADAASFAADCLKPGGSQ